MDPPGECVQNADAVKLFFFVNFGAVRAVPVVRAGRTTPPHNAQRTNSPSLLDGSGFGCVLSIMLCHASVPQSILFLCENGEAREAS